VSITLYMDVHVRQAITMGLRLRGVDVLTAQEDGARRLSDALLLDRATALGRVLFSQDEDLLREAAQRQERGVPFTGVIYAHQLKVTIGQCIRDLELLAHAGAPEDFANRVQYLLLR
jgi:predicted nuclease of predicted toxin-antitoxin system